MRVRGREEEVVFTKSNQARIALVVAALALVACTQADARVSAVIEGAGTNRVPIALAPLAPVSSPDAALENEFGKVLAGDLEISGMFRIIDPASYIERVPPGPL